MKYETWVETFQPLTNPFSNTAEIDGYVFSTRGPEAEFVRTHPLLHVWSFIVEDGPRTAKWFICDGFHTVNLMGYLVTRKPSDPHRSYEIRY